MEEAIRLSLYGMENGLGGPFGAVVVKDGLIVGRGVNQVTSTHDPTAHAEIIAIRDACQHLQSFQLEGCKVYASCEPCPMCLGALYWARPAQVFYACTKADAARIQFDDAFIYEELSRPNEGKRLPMVPLLRERGLEVFRSWEAKSDKIKY